MDNLEFLGRCGHIELLAGGVADDVCPGMDNAFALFYQGFAVMGCGYVLASVAWLFGIQRLGKNALEGEGESMEKEDMDKKDGDDEA